MFRRAPSYFVLLIAVIFVFAKARTLFSIADAAKPWTTDDYVEIWGLFAVLVAAIVAIDALRRDRASHRIAGPTAAHKLALGGTPFENLRQLPQLVRKAFRRRPVVSSLMTLVLAFIPVGLIAMSRRDGLHAFRLPDWILLAVVESPLLLVVLLVVDSFWTRRDETP